LPRANRTISGSRNAPKKLFQLSSSLWIYRPPLTWRNLCPWCNENVSCEPNHAYQNAYHACTFGPTLVLRWSTISFISLYSAIINPYATRTYKRQIRTENPCVGGSIPPLPICNSMSFKYL
jgi:hypothetical protein